jgi:hypothetical protein
MLDHNRIASIPVRHAQIGRTRYLAVKNVPRNIRSRPNSKVQYILIRCTVLMQYACS